MAVNSICSILGCGKPLKAKGLCENHRYRLGKYGDPLGGRTPNGEPMRLAIESASILGKSECISWPYNRNSAGYGMVSGRLAHRIVCEIAHGSAPTPTHEAAHSCGKGHEGCINPDHLSWKTRAANLADRVEHGTHDRGERNSQSKITESQVREIRSLKRKSSLREISEAFGISKSTISLIHRGKRWAWVT